jgi:acyl-CoA thioesterase
MTAMGSIDRDPAERASSLNHAMWFHEPLPPDWMLATWSPVTTTHRLSLIEGSFHTPDGTRCATFVQELLMRATAPSLDEARGRLGDGR